MFTKLKNLKYILCCSVGIIFLLNLIFAINYRIKYTSVNTFGDLAAENSMIKLRADDNGNILFEENNLFKKYTIICSNENYELNWEDKTGSLDINLGKELSETPAFKTDKKIDNSDVYYRDTKSGFLLSFKKIKDNNNFVYQEKNNKKYIIVLISKIDKPMTHTIVIDAGHGGQDKGANYGSIYEKDINLKIANYTADQLRFNGFSVVQTRDTDNLLSLKEVGNITNSANGDIFISIHVNENNDSKYQGVTTYYYDQNSVQKDERIRLATVIQNELIKNDGWMDRGILKQNFAVLRYSTIPCVLLECGFLSNSEDRKKLAKDIVLKNFANNITKGVINYFDSE